MQDQMKVITDLFQKLTLIEENVEGFNQEI